MIHNTLYARLSGLHAIARLIAKHNVFIFDIQ